jgi:hypothetical protein
MDLLTPSADVKSAATKPEEGAVRRDSVAKAVVQFIVGFVLVAGVIHLCIQSARRPLRLYAAIRSEKLQLLDEWHGRALSAAFGSSHVHDGFDPRAFDAELKDTALRTVSINLGVEGGSQGEQRVMALEFLRQLHKPQVHKSGTQPGACFVVLELTAGANLMPKQLIHPRSINIYDWDTTKFIFSLSMSGLGLRREMGRDLFAVSAAGLHAANLGMLSSMIFDPPLDKAMIAAQTSNDRRGLHNEAFNAHGNVDVVRALDERPPTSKPLKQSLLPGNYDLLTQLSAASQVSNVQFVYFVAPMLSDVRNFPDYPATIQGPGGTVPIVNLARPDRYPELYQRQYWYDGTHLNEIGAGVASRLLADELKKWYAEHTVTAVCGG